MRSMSAKKIKATVLEKIWLTPSVMRIVFKPNKPFKFEPGQFLSIFVPNPSGETKFIRRAYSFAQCPAESKREGYELCVKYVEDGIGTNYLKSLNPGDTFIATAPYGDFCYKPDEEAYQRNVCFICTGTGIAPFRSMLLSEQFRENPPDNVLLIFGVRYDNEILYQAELESMGVKAVFCVSRPSPNYGGFKGRVTDYLRIIPNDWHWHTTDFYLCGNSDMIIDAQKILVGGHGVKEARIHKEAFAISPTATITPQKKIKAA